MDEETGSDGRGRGDRQQSDGEDGGGAFGPSVRLDDSNDTGLRREIRSKYRDLITSVQRE